MTDFKAKMHQIRFWLGLRPRPRWGSLQRSHRPRSWTVGAASRQGEELGWETGGKGEGRGSGRPPSYCWTMAPQSLATPLCLPSLVYNDLRPCCNEARFWVSPIFPAGRLSTGEGWELGENRYRRSCFVVYFYLSPSLLCDLALQCLSWLAGRRQMKQSLAPPYQPVSFYLPNNKYSAPAANADHAYTTDNGRA